MQAFVQKLAVCLLDVDRNPDSPMCDQLNNWTAEATCFVCLRQLSCIADTFVLHMLNLIAYAWHRHWTCQSESDAFWCMASQDL